MNHKSLVNIGIWVAIVAVAFGVAWYQGYLLKFREYWNSTMEEMRKCTWPTWDELKGSTVVVSIAIALLSAFTFVADEVFAQLVRLI